SCSPYTVSTVTVNAGAQLTIADGVTVNVLSGGRFSISGTLTTTGTDASPVTITSTNASPAPGDWYAIDFESSSTSSSLAYTTISNNTGPGITADSTGTNTIMGNTISSNGGNGIHASTGGASATADSISGNTISGNTGDGLDYSRSPGSPATLTNNTITNSGS